jgi:Fur family ferric uptake transcriptional regulator
VHQQIDIETLCQQRGLRITEQRRVIAKVLSESDDHPDVDQLRARDGG